MVTSEERIRILSMLQEGKITAEEANRLLSALGQAGGGGSGNVSRRNPNHLRVQVIDTRSGKTKVRVNVPMSIVNMGFKLGARFIPSDADIDMEELMEAINSGAVGKIFEAEDGEDGERVEVWVE
ncbi:MAG: hypothetical protein L0154_27590 [Chloroflexi bacterium]|nr:hypothetical protein [Chloroflexota bacterium]